MRADIGFWPIQNLLGLIFNQMYQLECDMYHASNFN